MLTRAAEITRAQFSRTGTGGHDRHTTPWTRDKRCLKTHLFALAATLTVVHVVLATATATAQENGDYPDIDPDAYYAAPVRGLADEGVFASTECEDGFCPDNPIDRSTMAVWTVRVLDGTDPVPVTSTRFTDVDASHPHAAFIERFAELGVTKGCGDGTEFCPDGTVIRAEMAVFLARAFHLDEGPDPGFGDVPSDAWYASEVASLAASGITKGCGDGSVFCPGRATLRAQMAVFLHRAINRDSHHAGPPLVAIESTAPLVTSGNFEVTLRFSKPVTGLSRSEIIVVNGQAASLAGSEARYTARIEPAAEGTVMVRLPASTVRSGDGSPNEASAALVRTIAPAARSYVPGLDTWNRPLVLQSADLEFNRSEPDWGFTGSVGRCEPGTTRQAFRDSVIQRVNWYRQMAGLDTVTEESELSAGAQDAALIMVANEMLSHDPGEDWDCYTQTGAASAGRSNLGLGRVGVAGIDAYMQDYGDNNRRVGHRRWILDPQTLEVGTGNVRKPDTYMMANALDILGGDRLGSRPGVREERSFVAWPPSGYVPAGVVWGRWSFSLADADFLEASVAVAVDSGPVAVEILDRDSRAGGPGIVWAVAGDTNSILLAAPTDGDHCYTVTVSGVRMSGQTQTPYEYPVCVIDLDAATGPSVTLDSASPAAVGGGFDVSVTFSEPVNGFTRDDIYVSNGAVTALSGRDRQYEATIRADDDGAVVVTVGAGAVHDSRSLPNTAAAPLRRTAEVGRPDVRVTSPATRTVHGPFDVSIAFSAPVTSFSAHGIKVVNGDVSDLTGSGASYRATITPRADGTVMVRVRQDSATAGNGRANQASAPLTRLRTARPQILGPGFDTWDRAAVLDAHTAEFDRVEPDWGYTGDVDGCVAGTTSQAFRSSVVQRINWYRAMAGLDTVDENTTYSEAAQRVALIYLANGSFEITADSECYSAQGSLDADRGSGSLGVAGVAEIDRNMSHGGASSSRATTLTPHLVRVGIGHARDPDSRYRVAHMLYQDYADPWSAPRPVVRQRRGFIAWPPPGYVPLEAVWEQWSFSLAGADFSAASVTVSDHFGPVRAAVVEVGSWYREQTIAWTVGEGADLARRPGPTGADACYAVTVSGARINGATQDPYEYAVCMLETDS